MRRRSYVAVRLGSYGLILVMMLSCLCAVAFAAESETKIVRIGYYENDNFQAGASDELVKSGYSYEYMQRLQMYTDWEYEYVYGEYGDLYQALLDGEIDLLTGLAYRQERASIIYYPGRAMGDTPYNFLKKSERTDITADPRTIAGKKIGVLEGAMTGIVRKYLDNNEITAEMIIFTDLKARDQALLDGTVDITIVEGNSTGTLDGVEAFAEAGASDYYVVVSRKRPDILKELNDAQRALFKASPEIKTELSEKWFRQNAISTTLTENERAWISEHDSFTIGYYNDFLPYSATDRDGNVTGIVADVANGLFSAMGIDSVEILYRGFNTYDEMIEALRDHEIDVLFPAYCEYWTAEQYGVMPTNEIICSYFDLIYERTYPDMEKAVIAIPESNNMIKAFAKVAYPGNKVAYYASTNACLDAVVAGKADAALVNGLRTSTILLTKDSYNSLHSAQVSLNAPLGFAARRNDSGTIEILNHAIGLVDPDFALTMTYRYEETHGVSVIEFLRQNRWLPLTVVAVIAIIIIFFEIKQLLKNKRFLKREEKQNRELEDKVIVISALNEQLNEHEAQLEQVSAEQAAQIEEIAALNEQLRERQVYTDKLYHRLIKIQSCGVVAYRVPSHELIIMNDMAKSIYGLPLKGYLEVSDILAHTGKARYDKADSLEKLKAIHEPGDKYSYTFRIGNTDADELHIFATTQLMQMYNGDRVIVSSLLDITEIAQKEREIAQANAANTAKTSFLFSMSHDIRTPMNAIIGYTNLMEKAIDDPVKTRDYLGKIKSSSDFLLSLINDVLEMARIESGKSTLDEEIVSTSLVSEEVQNVYADLMRAKNIRFTNILDVKTPYVFCDKVKLSEIFLNLVSNAYKYTPDGGSVKVEIVEKPCDRDGWVTIQTTVSDTGIGMSKEYLPILFEEFSREKNATDAKIQGTGLGMPIVKKLVDLMQGTITVESELGKGTTFVVTTTHRIANAPEEYREQSVEADPERIAGKRILLAEDNDLNAEIAIEILSDVGLIVDRAEDGIVCVDMLTKAAPGTYDMILMDIQMPNMDGYRATEKIRRLADPAKANIPIVAMTANAFEEDKRNAMKAGMNGHLAKPIDVAQLMKTLVGILG